MEILEAMVERIHPQGTEAEAEVLGLLAQQEAVHKDLEELEEHFLSQVLQ
jgi:hypothetical protein